MKNEHEEMNENTQVNDQKLTSEMKHVEHNT